MMPLIDIRRHSIDTMEGKRIGILLWFTEVLFAVGSLYALLSAASAVPRF